VIAANIPDIKSMMLDVSDDPPRLRPALGLIVEALVVPKELYAWPARRTEKDVLDLRLYAEAESW
jgi:hypothetical protein